MREIVITAMATLIKYERDHGRGRDPKVVAMEVEEDFLIDLLGEDTPVMEGG